MTSMKALLAAALVGLIVPVAALATEAKVDGPMALAGAGFFGGELKLAAADDQRPVRLNRRGGYVGFLDLAGDLKVRCAGKGRVHRQQTARGTVHLCGRGGPAVAKGSHFRFRGFAARYQAVFPAGTTGTFHGRFARCVQAGDGWQCERPERQAREPQRPAAKPEPDDDGEVPTLAELAAMLAGK